MDASSQTGNGTQDVEVTRRKWSFEDRQRIVQASLKKGTTVNAVAKVYGVHPSQIYDWRKQYRQEEQRSKAALLVPVQITEPDQSAAPGANQAGGVVIEACSTRVTLNGNVDVAVIRAVLECLVR
jgi:transposase-like protein